LITFTVNREDLDLGAGASLAFGSFFGAILGLWSVSAEVNRLSVDHGEKKINISSSYAVFFAGVVFSVAVVSLQSAMLISVFDLSFSQQTWKKIL